MTTVVSIFSCVNVHISSNGSDLSIGITQGPWFFPIITALFLVALISGITTAHLVNSRQKQSL